LNCLRHPSNAWSIRGLAFVAAVALVSAARACGPFFPNWLLADADRSVLVAPAGLFSKELERMDLIQPAHRAKPAVNQPRQTVNVERADLRLALEQIGVAAEQREITLKRHAAERQKIAWFVTADDEPAGRAPPISGSDLYVLRPQPNDPPRIRGPVPEVIPGLPGEFADYFRGSIAWHQGDFETARSAWNALLTRPAAERHFKSTWAAFMLGKSWEETHPSRAFSFYQMVRSLAKDGFADNLGLAAASLGWEARLVLRQKKYAPAIDLYLEQAASGDPTADLSLEFAASAALAGGPSALSPLAAHPRAQRVITAYIISHGHWVPQVDVDGPVKELVVRALKMASAKFSFIPTPASGWHKIRSSALLWLEAVEAAQVRDVAAAEQLALAAYQAGEMETAQRWVMRAKATPVAEWLQAKLFLREGKIDEAAALLARVCKVFPLEPAVTNALAWPGLDARLVVHVGGHQGTISVGQQALGELGVLRLARRQYVEALDALLRAGFWADAAYVAEKVLTLEELKNYVDQQWPPETAEPPAPAGEAEGMEQEQRPPTDPRYLQLTTGGNIRYLLGRRLARAKRLADARSYYPFAWSPKFDRFHQAMRLAEQEDLPREQRAQAYWEAAKLARYDGLELLGTEVEPDWRYHGGNFVEGPSLESRIASPNLKYLGASTEEEQRALRHVPDPDERFHYRYTAASLAWEAARLMPNNSDDTARVLCIAGSWLKHRDPQAADLFYKALVRRCRKTALGAEADRLRWFPILDGNGNMKPK